MRFNYCNFIRFFLLYISFTIYIQYGINAIIEKNKEISKQKYKPVVNPFYKNVIYKNKTNERNVVVGLLANYNYTVVEPYFNSLRKSGYKEEIICFTLDKSLSMYEEIYEKYNIQSIIFSTIYPYYITNNKNYPISAKTLKKMFVIPHDIFFFANIRFFLIYIWLFKYSPLFSFILTSDFRDTIFQRNPFNWNYNKGIYFTYETQHCKYYESKICSRCNYNWFFNLNPPKHLLNNTFINAGQIFGSSIELRVFLKEYTELMYNIHLKNNRRVDTCDQGILNWYILNENEFNFPVYIFKAEYGYARVIGLDLANNKEGFEPNENFTIINIDNTIPVLVHQYDIGLKYGSKERIYLFNEFFYNFVNI